VRNSLRLIEPSEQNNDHLNEQLRLQTHLSRTSIPKNISPTVPSSISRLLSYPLETCDKTQLATLEIMKQPKRFWKSRSINCLANRECPDIRGEGEKQRKPVVIKVRQ
jgi:hypothetical protein